MARKINTIYLIGFILFSGLSQASTMNLDKASSTVEFLAVGRPSMIKIHGKGANIEGHLNLAPEKSEGTFKVDLESFDTGMSLRNQHMKEKYLETKIENNKYAILTISKLDISQVALTKGGTFDVPFSGTLTLHGVTKDISSSAHVNLKDKSFDGTSQLKIKLTDYKINIPTFAGVTVAEDVSIDIQLKGLISDIKK